MATAVSAGPDFMCVGAQKAGTQWLYDQLVVHPGFWMPPLKELHHFDLPGTREKKARRLLARATEKPERDAARRAAKQLRPLDQRDLRFLRDFADLPHAIDLDRYAALFAGKGDRLSGDITPGYSVLESDTIAALAARFPDLKVVFIVRDPVARFWSAVNMRLRRGDLKGRTSIRTVRSFAQRKGVSGRSLQAASVARWRQGFGDRFALFFFDDLAARPEAFRRSVLAFLGASPDEAIPVAPDFNRKKGNAKIGMTDAMRAALAELFADELRACADTFGGPARDWPKAYGL